MPEAMQKLKVLFLCTGNSCRSQMAEGWTRHLRGDRIEPYSAGIETHGLDPNAVKVMAEAGVDISGHHSKHTNEVMGIPFDYEQEALDHYRRVRDEIRRFVESLPDSLEPGRSIQERG